MRAQLIIEGGGMRGVYTAGVLDYFMEQQLKFLDVLAVSSGACNAISYKSNQPGRNIEIYTKYARDKRYLSIRSLLRHGNIFGFDFIFNTLPQKLVHFNYDYFNKSQINVEVVVTNAETGLAEYYPINTLNDDLPYLRASCSIPVLSRMVNHNNLKLLDGGIADSIPIRHSLESGFSHQVLILTRTSEYQKKKIRGCKFLRARYPRYPNLIKAIRNRYKKYNNTLDLINELEGKKKVFVIRPSEHIKIGRFEKEKDKLMAFYDQGRFDAKKRFAALLKYLSEVTNVYIK